MPSNKRRKLDIPADKPPLSAFARRKALQSITQGSRTRKGEDEEKEVIPSTLGSPAGDHAGAQALPAIFKQNAISGEQFEPKPNSSRTKPDEAGQSSSLESRIASPEIQVDRPALALSSFRPSKSNFQELKDSTIRIKLAPSERLVILGRYELTVKKGQVTMMGSTLQASKASYPVFAESSHSLPVIRCLATDVNEAEISIHQHQSGLETLGALSPLFSKLGNENPASLGLQFRDTLQKSTKSTFQILFSSEDTSQRTYVQPIISAPEWNAVLAKCSVNVVDTRPPIIMICGPKSSGKSTFAKLLTNKLLLPSEKPSDDTKSPKPTGVVLLDIDPGQPEYSPPGQLALLHIQDPNYGPPFTHPIPGTRNRILRSHSIAALSPAMDTNHYIACVLDLVTHYQHLRWTVPGCPLVINTPGWVLGTGLEILLELITRTRPSSIIYMSQEGPPEVINSLREAAKSIPVTTLPSQVSEYTTRTAAHLRTMQYLSYFHLKPGSNNVLSWNGLPLTSIPPWEIRYSGENAGILGVMCYGEQPTPGLLADTINGSLVAVVVIDDMAAIPGWSQTEKGGIGAKQPAEATPQRYPLAEGTDMGILEEDSFEPRQIKIPLIVTTPKEGIPYFNPANSITLNPRHSHSIGLALVRGIDIARRRLQALTPISANDIHDINDAGKPIVLVSGKLDTPGWAYTEELTLKTNRERESTNDTDSMILGDDEGEEDEINIEGIDITPASENQIIPTHGFENAPWVERLEGSQGRGIGSRVWRVRRDLGKQGDGGE